ncbi:MAG: hypothetical protein K2K38_02275 [Clostridia bacterium]|nr:hypothetical protein [Clostridia bacterium]
MKLVNELAGIVNKETGQTYNGWQFSMPNEITQYFGTVTAQFFFYSPQGVLLGTSSTTFTIGKGVPQILPPTPTENVYDLILENISALAQEIKNVSNKAIVIWGFNEAVDISDLNWEVR